MDIIECYGAHCGWYSNTSPDLQHLGIVAIHQEHNTAESLASEHLTSPLKQTIPTNVDSACCRCKYTVPCNARLACESSKKQVKDLLMFMQLTRAEIASTILPNAGHRSVMHIPATMCCAVLSLKEH